MRVEIEIAESGHLRPLAATCGHSLGTVWSGHLRPLAATCGHLRPLAVTHLALSGAAACGPCLEFCGTCGRLLQRPLAATCGHLRPLAVTHLELSGAAACGPCCGHLRPLTPATCRHSLGTVWSGHLRPLAATHLEPRNTLETSSSRVLVLLKKTSESKSG